MKNNVINNIYYHLRTYGEFLLWDVDIYDDNMKGEVHKGVRVFIDEDNIAMIELDNGEIIDIQELDYNELVAVYDEIV